MNYAQLGKAHMIFARAIDDLRSEGINTNFDDRIAATRLFSCLTAQMRQGQLGFLDTRAGKFRAFDARSDRARSFDIRHRAADEHTDLSDPSLADVQRWLEGFQRGTRRDREFAARLAAAIRAYLDSDKDADWMRRSADRSRRYGEASMRDKRRAADADSSDAQLIRRAICGFARPATHDEEWIHSSAMRTFTS